MFFERKISATVRERKMRPYHLAIKSVDEAGRFTGYASVFGVVDHQNDVIVPNAFRGSLFGREREIKLLWQHNQAEPIGVFDVVREDARGLYVEGQLLMDVQRAKEAYALLQSGAINGLSIGYSPVRFRTDPVTKVRYLEEVELFEISLVTFPANSRAQVALVKQADDAALAAIDDSASWQHAMQCGELVALHDALSRALDTLGSLDLR